MSHKVKVVLGDYDLGVLRTAFEDLGWMTQANAVCRGLSGRHLVVARNPDDESRYDVALDTSADDKVHMAHESDLRLGETGLGVEFSLLKQQYQARTADRYAKMKQGKTLSSQKLGQVLRIQLEVNV